MPPGRRVPHGSEKPASKPPQSACPPEVGSHTAAAFASPGDSENLRLAVEFSGVAATDWIVESRRQAGLSLHREINVEICVSA
jgi:hypothetical protein